MPDRLRRRRMLVAGLYAWAHHHASNAELTVLASFQVSPSVIAVRGYPTVGALAIARRISMWQLASAAA